MKTHRTSSTVRAAALPAPFERAVALMLVVLMVLGVALSAAPIALAGDSDVTPRLIGPPHSSGPPDGFEEVVSLAVGDGPGEVGVSGGEEIEPWGPSAFALDEAGRFHIIDGVNGRVLRVDPSGEQVAIEWSDPVVCPVDISLAGGRTFLLDLPAQPAAVREIDDTGREVASWEIPAACLDHAVTGLDVSLDAKGAPDVRLELAGTWQVRLTGPGSARTQRLPVVLDGDAMRVPASAVAPYAIQRSGGRAFSVDKEWSTGHTARATSFAQGRPDGILRVSSAERLGAVRYIDTDVAGNAYLWVEDLPREGARTRAFVKRFAADGIPSALFEVPVDVFATHPTRPVRVTEDGTAYLLVPGSDRISVLRVLWTPDTAESLPAVVESATREPEAAQRGEGANALPSLLDTVRSLFTPEPAIAAWTPTNANDRAWTYVNHYWYCNTKNYSTRNGSIRPRYLTSANRYYYAVPYCWGGFDTISSYRNAMSAGYSAGDINCTGAKRAGTAGVDCSGFVSRLWGLGTKRSTSTLRYVARAVSKSSMKLGDAYIWPGSHCMFFRYYTPGGAQVFESTKTNSYDRVVTMNRTNSALANYGAWRYQNW
ncbi:MAG: hypothetical protein IBX63_09920 [Coriobacteriia bacterium]|nr:hypothetical protein [Coriobacteriia bacterium]